MALVANTQSRAPLIGRLGIGDSDSGAVFLAGFLKGMTNLCYVEGRYITMALRWVGGANIKAGSADGEIVVPPGYGTTAFSVLQNEFNGRSASIVLIVWSAL